MKYIAKQVLPEYQESPLSYMDIPDMYPGIIIAGNRDFHGYTTDLFNAIKERFAEEKICRALSLMTGKKYERRTIRGCCQREWQNVYYPANEYSRDTLQLLESDYFNLGSEWLVSPETNPEDATSIYCYGWNTDLIREEIAAAFVADQKDITMYEFDGYTQTAKYKVVQP